LQDEVYREGLSLQREWREACQSIRGLRIAEGRCIGHLPLHLYRGILLLCRWSDRRLLQRQI